MMPVASAMRPMTPPSASISRTICPLARPPIAGLQDIVPIRAGSMVIMATRPSTARKAFAAAQAASIPACPPPITITEYRIGTGYARPATDQRRSIEFF